MAAPIRIVGAWHVYLDENTKREYYCHSTTRVTMWEAPDEIRSAVDRVRVFGPWQVIKDPNTQRDYFFNATTNVNTWLCPPEIQSEFDASRGFNQGSTSEKKEKVNAMYSEVLRIPYAQLHPWNIFFDKATGRSYFFNVLTLSTTWECPAEVASLVQDTQASTTSQTQTIQSVQGNKDILAPINQTPQSAKGTQDPPTPQTQTPQTADGTQEPPTHQIQTPQSAEGTQNPPTPQTQTPQSDEGTQYLPTRVTSASMFSVLPPSTPKGIAGPRPPPRRVTVDTVQLGTAHQGLRPPLPKCEPPLEGTRVVVNKLTQLSGLFQLRIKKKWCNRFVILLEGDLQHWESADQTGPPDSERIAESVVEVATDSSGSFLSISSGKSLQTQILMEKKEDENKWLSVLQANGCNNASAVLKEGSLVIRGNKKPRRVVLHANRLDCFKEAKKPDLVVHLTRDSEIVALGAAELEVREGQGKDKGKSLVVFGFSGTVERNDWATAIRGVTKGLLSAPFGGSLAKGVLASEFVVPECIFWPCTHLRLHVATEGLFRVPGASNQVVELMRLYNEYKRPSFAGLDIHAVAGLVKRYFRELSEPFLPAAVREEVMKLNVKNGQDMASKQQKLKVLVDGLPIDVHHTLNYICHFLVFVAANSGANKMTVENCAMVFAPGILRKDEDDSNVETVLFKAGEDMEAQAAVLSFCISNYSTFFPGGPPYP